MAKLDLEDFVAEVRKSSCLYNLSDPGYKDPKLKERRWTAIGTKFGFTGRAAQLKWKNVRDRYVRAKRLMETEKVNGITGASRKWWLYDILDDFLNYPKISNGQCPNEVQGDSSTMTCLSKDNFASPILSENETQLCQEIKVEPIQLELSSDSERLPIASPETTSSSSQQSTIKIRYKRQKRRLEPDNSTSVSKLMCNMSATLQKIESVLKSSREDPDDVALYLLSLAPRMRRLSPHQRSQARLRFEQTLFEFESGNVS